MANNFCLHFRYYSDKVLTWSLNNKMIVFLGTLSFCLFVSTLAMSSQRNSARAELDDLRLSLLTTPASVETTTDSGSDNTTTENSVTTTGAPAEITTTAETITTTDAATENTTESPTTTAPEPETGGTGQEDSPVENSRMMKLLGFGRHEGKYEIISR